MQSPSKQPRHGPGAAPVAPSTMTEIFEDGAPESLFAGVAEPVSCFHQSHNGATNLALGDLFTNLRRRRYRHPGIVRRTLSLGAP